MKNYCYIIFFFAPFAVFSQETLTLADLYKLAEENYPLSQQTELLEEQSNTEIGIIKKGKLPKINLNAQATYQSEVIRFPLDLPNTSVKPPNKDQYRATLDVNQLIYQGGKIAANTKLKEAELETQQQQVNVDLYTLRTQINQLYFSVLLYQEQANLQSSKMEQLEVNLKEVTAGVKYGALLPSAAQTLEAEILTLEQQLSETHHNRKKALERLGALVSKNLDSNTELAKPSVNVYLESVTERPEIKLFELQEDQLETSKEVISKTNYPQISGFGQAGYGNPGLNMLDNSFQDFYMAGVKLSWNIFDWGKTKQEKKKVEISKNLLATEKETFELNNSIQLKGAQSDIAKLEDLLQKDESIINLREQVLSAATSQFQNGAIRSSEYVIELNNLYEAKINRELHQTQLSLAKANYNVIKEQHH